MVGGGNVYELKARAEIFKWINQTIIEDQDVRPRGRHVFNKSE